MADEKTVSNVVEIKEGSSLKMRLTCGQSEDGKLIVRSRTYSNVRPSASGVDVYNVAKTLESLQKHQLIEVIKQDNTNLNE